MSSVKEYYFDLEEQRAEEWIRERLSDQDFDEESEEWQDLAEEYSNLQEYLRDEAEWKAEVEWLKENGSSEIHKIFVDELDALKLMVENSSQNNPRKMVFLLHSNMLVKMSFAYAVTLLESFLGDTLKSLISQRKDFLQNAMKNVEEVSKAKYSITQLSETDMSINSLVLKNISEILFHNIPKVKKVYEQVLGVKLNLDISKVSKITSIRHDIVHRNGYTKNSKPINISIEDFYQAIEHIKDFSSKLQTQINAL